MPLVIFHEPLNVCVEEMPPLLRLISPARDGDGRVRPMLVLRMAEPMVSVSPPDGHERDIGGGVIDGRLLLLV